MHQTLLNFYVILFIFTMFNREFLLFGLDLRFIQLPLGMIICLVGLLSKQYKSTIQKNDTIGKSLLVFYVFAIISNISWLWNGLEPKSQKFINEIVLLLNVFISVSVFYFNKTLLNSRIIYNTAIISCLILSASIFLVHQGFELQDISGSPKVEYIYRSTSSTPHINLFGEDFRCAGYASDPNYATVLLLIAIVCTIYSKHRKYIKAILISIFLISIGLSFSKTIILSAIPCIICTWFCRCTKISTVKKVKLNRIIIVFLLSLVIVTPLITPLANIVPGTISTRLSMWRVASSVFTSNPILGGGITSFRSAFAINHWYVQAHSTYWQVLSELGLIGIILYYRIILKALNFSMKSSPKYFLTLMFIVWILMCESIALPFGIFIYYLMPSESTSKRQKTALFIVNSLKRGGAEKVCLTLANELIHEKYLVDFIVLSSTQNQHKAYNIYNLKLNQKNKVIRIIQTIFYTPKVNDFIVAQQLDHGNYELITSHLPMSNIITRLSCVRCSAIYVLHTTLNSYRFEPRYIYYKIIQAFFWRKKVVSVSKNLRKELIHQFHLSTKYTRTIYNPINLSEIEHSVTIKRPLAAPYILHVGRFEKDKRQDLMLQIYKDGHFNQKYDLVFCGTGSTLNEIKAKVGHQLLKKVHFMGYQDNIYNWMKHAEILVSTSSREAFPMNLIEAFACNTKVISSDCNYGPKEILLGDYKQYLVRPIDDTQQYIKKIKSALKHYPASKNPIIKQLQPSTAVERYIRFYNQK